MTSLHPKILADLAELRPSLEGEGRILPPERLQACCDAFRRAHGPEVLRSLDGLALLEHMHDHGNRESLVYWLELRDDDTFPAGSRGAFALSLV
jgi:5-methylcytosine-specific restriction protein B